MSSVVPSASPFVSAPTTKLLLSPATLSSRSRRLSATATATATDTFHRLGGVWESLQVSRSGQFSPERLRALDEYSARASLPRCLAVLLLTPVPSLAFVLLLESLALRPPAAWRSDAAIWLRMALTTTSMGYCYVLQFRQVIPELPVTQRRSWAIGAIASACYLAFLALLATYWTFPVPLGFVVTATPYSVFLSLAVGLVLGVAQIRAIPAIASRARQLVHVLLVQSLLVFVYPAYTALFVWLDASQQPYFVVCLPAIKLAAKNLMARACLGTRLEDQAPEITVFSVELFNALYLSACVSVAGSAQTTMAVIMALDLGQTLLSLRALRRRARRLQATSPDGHASASGGGGGGGGGGDGSLATRKLLFSAEYLVLVEYIECFIPAVSLAYTAVVRRWPNAQFYPRLRRMTDAQASHTAASLAVYVGVEVLSLLLLVALARRWLGVNMLRHLAFVLERDVVVIQAKLLVWVTYSLTFTLEHSGMDFERITTWLERKT
ncbi:hypothetical protein P43SY_010138 [Pythium insidiosum]|uniref:Transmembrane protein n=1 Tax=Pythium insidiosum TaxID=114742 RepID=A0AAD5Q4A7_PYTIN|nr:hypothetical protein P43SY_010138 [Pythium insidiosum]